MNAVLSGMFLLKKNVCGSCLSIAPVTGFLIILFFVSTIINGTSAGLSTPTVTLTVFPFSFPFFPFLVTPLINGSIDLSTVPALVI